MAEEQKPQNALIPAPNGEVADATKLEPREQPAPQPESVTPIIIRRSSSTAWAVASVFVVAILAAAYIVYTVIYSLPAKVVETGGEAVNTTIAEASRIPERLAGAFKPAVNVNTVFSSAIKNARNQSKLVVMTAEVDVNIDKTSEKRVLWDALRLGDTTVRLRVRDNKVQYYIPMDQFTQEMLTYQPERNALVATVPTPRLDEEVVEVQSNPDRVEAETEVGWGRLEAYSGRHLLDEARRELRDAVLREGANPLLQEKARTEAEQAVRNLLNDLLPYLREGVTIDVQFS